MTNSSSSGLASGIGGFLGSIGSSLIGQAFTGHNMYKQYKYSKKLQQQQYNLQMRGLREGYTNARQGLESAGLNPILAATGGSVMPSIGTGSASAPNVSFGNPVESAVNTIQGIQNAKLTNAQAEKVQTETENLGNSPFNAVGNFIKGILGKEGKSSTEVSQSVGTWFRDSAKKFGPSKVLNFMHKLQHLDSLDYIDNPNNAHNFYDIGISNTDDGFIRKRSKFTSNAFNVFKNRKGKYDTTIGQEEIHFSPSEEKMIDSLINNSFNYKYQKPPKSLLK